MPEPNLENEFMRKHSPKVINVTAINILIRSDTNRHLNSLNIAGMAKGY